MADLLELARRHHRDGLAQQAQLLRSSPNWSAACALELACAWLLAGDHHQADLAYVQADLLDPSLALVPDVWGLWPAPPANPERDGAAQAWAERFAAWRHPDPQALWRALQPQLHANWKLALEPEAGDALLILGRASGAAGAPPLDPPLEQELVQLVADAEIAAEPAASNRYWQLVATIRPHWDLARIRAADLALSRGDLETSARWLLDPPAAALANPWFHDVAARQALASGSVDLALDAWAEAIKAAQAADESAGESAGLVAIFEQRRREARRGPGVLAVRSLANRGEQAAALALLERLLAEDPQWQPLRSLREQLQVPAESGPAAAVPAEPGAVAVVGQDPGDFDALLQRAAARLQALGIAVPEVAAVPEAVAVPEAGEAALQAWSRQLSDYEARFALA